MERWDLFDATLTAEELRGSFFSIPGSMTPISSAPGSSRAIHAVSWRKHDGEWLVHGISKFATGALPVIAKYTDYRRVGGIWIPHRIDWDFQIERRRMSNTVVSIGGPVPVRTFKPPLPQEAGWTETKQLEELTASGWRAARIGPPNLPGHGAWAVQELRLNTLGPHDRLPEQLLEHLDPDNEPGVLRDLRFFVRGDEFIPFDKEDY
jgi:hypothetical protein